MKVRASTGVQSISMVTFIRCLSFVASGVCYGPETPDRVNTQARHQRETRTMSGERLTIKTPDGEFSAYVARPAAAQAPAVVVIQEIFGVNKVMRDITDELAAAGYLAICPDLFWRIEPGIDITDQSKAEWDRAFELFGLFDADKGIEDVQATIDAIRKDAGGTGKVGAVGYCLGGKVAYLTAARTDIDASVSYYGVGVAGEPAHARLLQSEPGLDRCSRSRPSAPADPRCSKLSMSPFPRRGRARSWFAMRRSG